MTANIARCIKIIKKRSVYSIVIASGFIVGIILGAIFSGAAEKDFITENAISYYVDALTVSGNFGGLFFSRVLADLGCLALFFATALTLYLLPMHFIIVIYRGYILGVAMVVFVTTFGINGFILWLFGILLQNAATSLALCLFSLLSYNSLLLNCKKADFQKLLKAAAICLIIAIIGAFAEFLLCALILRPLNFGF